MTLIWPPFPECLGPTEFASGKYRRHSTNRELMHQQSEILTVIWNRFWKKELNPCCPNSGCYPRCWNILPVLSCFQTKILLHLKLTLNNNLLVLQHYRTSEPGKLNYLKWWLSQLCYCCSCPLKFYCWIHGLRAQDGSTKDHWATNFSTELLPQRVVAVCSHTKGEPNFHR